MAKLITDLPSQLPNLTPLSWILTLTGLIFTTYVISSITAWYRLRHFPGPPLASFSYLWIVRVCASGRMADIFAQTEAYYSDSHAEEQKGQKGAYNDGQRHSVSPSTIRIGPNELLTSDPDVIRRTSAARSRYTRSTWYKLNTADPYADAMFNTLDTTTHDRIKAQTAPGYAGRDNPGLEREVDGMIGVLVDKIRNQYAAASLGENGGETKKPWLDLGCMTQFFTLDSISKVAFGEEFGMMESERDVNGIVAVVRDTALAITVVSVVPYLRTIFTSRFVLGLIGPSVKDKKGLGTMMRTGRIIVGKRFAQADAKDEQDMLGSFMRHGLTQRQCEMEALFQIVAGSDTTATTIRCTMLYLMTTPRAYTRLQAEIDEGIRAGRISSPIANAEANAMPYLQAVIIESLRIFSPFTGLPFKVVPPEGDIIDGKPVPGGTLVAPNFWTTGQNRVLFGSDADVFRPERWLQVDATQKAEMRRVAELAFGYGRWGCAGKMIAFLELNKVFVELLRRFDFQLVNPSRPWKSANFNLFFQTEMWVSVVLREGVEK
ncbi:Pisatin demethylase [Dichotomopilus funicola]|uniref:Cytochrome P450 monooxygenase ABA1 n=1 Tax=Dichotomopilus funicola TaxID=1934379 RepID=A0AAN6UZ11_9PEZI|nr:Pisatin demethylase [Dichotomopilus funicola]